MMPCLLCACLLIALLGVAFRDPSILARGCSTVCVCAV